MLKIKIEDKIIPTYEVGEPDKNPLFLDKRVYQASSGKIYPYPMIDKIYDQKVDKSYKAIVVENDYIELMILPELGGRIQYGYDKIKDYYFFYNNEVIKPALVGLCGPWLSGGVEFNWPQHHRPSTFNPVEYEIEEGKGYCIVWLSEIEKMSQLIGVAGIKIYENSNRVEVIGKSINPTNLPKTFLWWANIAVHCHEQYESFFPRDVKFVADHGKREVTSYPYANTQYYNMDYPSMEMEKRNITNYENIKVPMSYMAVGSKYDFFGGYDFKKRMGTMHISNTHTAPGKKQWTWGSGEFGLAWDRHLTDENGPYVELMAGVYTDNQPDFTWINPGETKEFNQTWYPFADVEKVLNANEQIAYNIIDENLMVYTTEELDLNIAVTLTDESICKFQGHSVVGGISKFQLDSPEQIASIDVNGLIFENVIDDDEPEFSPAIEAKDPETVSSTDELFNIGLHLEQYRHATKNPSDYYHEILKRDPHDSRANERLGYINLEKGNLECAQQYFETAIATLTKYNPNPQKCDVYYGLGTVHKLLGNLELAYKNFHKAIWDLKFKSAGYLELGKIDLKLNRLNKAKLNIQESLKYNAVNLQSLALNEYIASKLGINYDYQNIITQNPFNYYAKVLADKGELLSFISNDAKSIIELVEFLDEIGAYNQACELIELSNTTHPILKMYEALQQESNYEPSDVTGIFPYTIFERKILEKYIDTTNSSAAKYLLAILLYDKGENSKVIDLLTSCLADGYSTSEFYRVLALCEFNILANPQNARTYYLKAIEKNTEDSRLVYEFDQLRKILNEPAEERIQYLQSNMKFVDYRDDLKVEYSWLLCQLKKFDECINYMESTKFHPFEGGEGKVIEIYKTAKKGIINQLIEESEYKQAISMLETINNIPECLGEGIIEGSPNADVLYLLGYCHEKLGNELEAVDYFKQCTQEKVITSSKLSYKPEKLQMNYYQALAYGQLDDSENKEKLIVELENLAKYKLGIETKIDYFAISVPEFLIFNVDMNEINRAHCYYLLALCAIARDESPAELIAQSYAIDNSKLELVLL